MNQDHLINDYKKALEQSLRSEKKALELLKEKDQEIAILKRKVFLYENRIDRITNFLPIKIVLKLMNQIKGMR